MGDQTIVRPVENVEDLNEARVLALVSHLASILPEWRRGEDLRLEQSKLLDKLPGLTKALQAKQSNAQAIQSQLDGVLTDPGTYGFAPPILFVLGIGLFFWKPWLGILVVAGIGFAIFKLASRKAALLSLRDEAEAEIAAANDEYTKGKARSNQIGVEIKERTGGFPDVRMASISFGVEVTEILGHRVALDGAGLIQETTLKTVDVSALQENLSHISDRVEELLQVPPLLSPGTRNKAEDAMDTLFGEESELQHLVGDFTTALGLLRDTQIKLPLLSKQSVIAARISQGTFSKTNEKAISISGNARIAEEIPRFVAQVNETKQNGQQTLENLKRTFDNLEEACNLYASARTQSINTIHEQLVSVLNRASWCARRFYCPRAIQSPRFIEDLLSIDPNTAYLLPLDDLLGRLESDVEIAKRLDAKPELIDQIYASYEAVHLFLGNVTIDENGRRVEGGDRPKYLEDQLREAKRQFKNGLSKILTGATFPVLNFSTEAQLYYDPAAEEWRSDLIPYVYSTADILKYGGVIKTTSDLMIPLWEHLWTEKADFRKSELFRTNESMIRMSEKESEKLIEIGNQFRSDMRTVRENVYLLESELGAKGAEIMNFRDGMAELGLLSTKAVETISDEKLKHLFLKESPLATGAKYETLLSVEPQGQAERRGMVSDPIDIIREPDALLTFQTNQSRRLIEN